MTRLPHKIVLLILVTFVVGCATNAPAPVINKSPNRKIPAQRIVISGDSIYSISWLYGLDFLDIAKWNGLKSPYRLQQGQVLSLRPGKRIGTSGSSGVVVKTLPQSGGNSVATTSPLPAPEPAPKPATKAANNAPAQTAPAAGNLSSPTQWQWPAKGKVIANYSRKAGVNGIRIAGEPGSPVTASASGDVVYVGEGLRGYGKLIIVKHSKKFLSAYAHNRKILVSEGERVKSNQKIAEMGDSGADRTMLHFEIRVNGKPEDPLKYLR